MMRSRPATLLAVLALSAGLGACGSDDEVSSAIPSSTPDLTIPTATTDAPAGDGSSTTSTTSTSTTATGAAPPVAGGGGGGGATPPAAAAPQAAPQGSSTTNRPPSGQSTTGGAQAGGNEFKNFCSQNPGAC